jgi:hypothetical protein
MLINTSEISLCSRVEKWLSPELATSIRITRFARTRSGRRRYVHVEALRPDGPVGLFFFKHEDGVWRVFPQEDGRCSFVVPHTPCD